MPLPGSLHHLQDWWVIAAAGALFLVELFADKVPYFDLVWNALHTFVRVPVAAVIAYAASSQLSPQWHIASVVLASVVALAAHTGKTALRAGVTPSPEPVSNIGLSAMEDGFAIGLTWFATAHPYYAAGIAGVFIVLGVLMIRWVLRMVRRFWRELMHSPVRA